MSQKDPLSKKVELLTDDYAKQILAGCYNEPMSAQHISWKFNIPIAATYRRLNALKKTGLVEEVDDTEAGGNDAAKYKTSLKKAKLIFEEGVFSVKMEVGEEKIESEL